MAWPVATHACINVQLAVHSNGYMFFSIASGEWSSPAVTGTKPPHLVDFSFTKIDSRRAVVYGGYNGKSFGDAYVLELDKWVCQRKCRIQ